MGNLSGKELNSVELITLIKTCQLCLSSYLTWCNIPYTIFIMDVLAAPFNIFGPLMKNRVLDVIEHRLTVTMNFYRLRRPFDNF